jgi:glycosyltransferase involved in cell wall biosynthesis
MKQKKLLIFMPSIEGGGVEKNLFIISNFLVHKINKVFLITASKKYEKKFDKKINLVLPKLNIWDKLGRRVKYLICLTLLLKKFIIEKDIVVLCFQANIYCIILCKIFNKKIIVRSNSSPTGWSKNFLKNFIFKKILNKADQIIVNSLEFKKELKNKFQVSAKCIYNPLNSKEIIIKSKVFFPKIFKKKKSLKIINIGRYTEQKDQITLLKGLKILDKKINYEAVILGKGFLKNQLISYSKKNGLKNKIKFINFLPNPYPLIKQADIFVLSSAYEGLPNVLLEALTLNKFIISTNCPTGPKEILLNGKGGLLFKVGNHKQLANKIIYYFDNKKKCEVKLKNARSQLHRFDYSSNLLKYLNLINELI